MCRVRSEVIFGRLHRESPFEMASEVRNALISYQEGSLLDARMVGRQQLRSSHQPHFPQASLEDESCLFLEKKLQVRPVQCWRASENVFFEQRPARQGSFLPDRCRLSSASSGNRCLRPVSQSFVSVFVAFLPVAQCFISATIVIAASSIAARAAAKNPAASSVARIKLPSVPLPVRIKPRPVERRNLSRPSQSLMGSDGIVSSFPGFEFSVELGDGERASMDLIEFLGVSTLARSTRPLSLGERGGSTNKRRPRCWQAASKRAANSLPPSTWMARKGNGKRGCKVSRNKVAAVEVAR